MICKAAAKGCRIFGSTFAKTEAGQHHIDIDEIKLIKNCTVSECRKYTRHIVQILV